MSRQEVLTTGYDPLDRYYERRDPEGNVYRDTSSHIPGKTIPLSAAQKHVLARATGTDVCQAELYAVNEGSKTFAVVRIRKKGRR